MPGNKRTAKPARSTGAVEEVAELPRNAAALGRITPRSRHPRPTPLPPRTAGTPEQTVGERVRHLRLDRGWSQAELAARVSSALPNWGQTTVAKTEAASRPIRVNEAAAIAAALGVPVVELVVTVEDMESLRSRADVEGLLHEDASLRARHRELQREWDRVEHEMGVVEDRLDEVAVAYEAAVAALQEHQQRVPDSPGRSVP
jgi:transcriptional regulator with XRE-family HTH domain